MFLLQRSGFKGSPIKSGRPVQSVDEGPPKKHATFKNGGFDPEMRNAQLFYEDQFWASLGHGDPHQSVHTYEGQRWNIMVDGKVKKTIVIGTEATQTYWIDK